MVLTVKIEGVPGKIEFLNRSEQFFYWADIEIFWYQAQNKQTLESPTSEYWEMVYLLDSTCKTLVKYLWERIMAQSSNYRTKRISVSINMNNFNNNVNFNFPTKYYYEAHNIVVNIDPYLLRNHVVSILQLLSLV